MLKKLYRSVRLLPKKGKEPYTSFYKILAFYPDNITLYEQALLHKSSSIRLKNGKWINNERLEFLGDAILDAIVADIVFKEFEYKKEGFLTNMRSKLVQRETLNKLALEIGIDKLIKSSTRTTTHNTHMYGNALEALIGAIYLDRGYRVAKKFVSERLINKHINMETIAQREDNFKSRLIEWSQKQKVDLNFEVISTSTDNDNNPIFESGVYILGEEVGRGNGYSKKESQQKAAKQVFERLQKDPEFNLSLIQKKEALDSESHTEQKEDSDSEECTAN